MFRSIDSGTATFAARDAPHETLAAELEAGPADLRRHAEERKECVEQGMR